MKTKVLYSLLLIALLQFTFTDSKLTVVSPQQLASHFRDSEGIIPFALANYGNAPHGAHFVGGLALSDPIDACDRVEHFLAGEIQFDQNIIAVVRMGGCQNTVKTRNAQLAGAKMVILVQDTNEELPVEGFGTAAGTENIHIPTIMISKEDGDDIIKFIEHLPFPPLNPDDIIPIISINFPYDSRRDTVNLDFWMTSSDPASYEFLTEFSSHIGANMGVFQFTPHFVTWDCYMCKRTGYSGMVQATDDCLSNGRYCAPDPDREEGDLKGSDVLKEDLRQICAWKENPLVWWNYIDAYRKNCINKQDIEACSEKHLSGMSSRVDSCVKESFQSQGDMKTADTSLLAAEKELQLEYDITEFPVLMINHKPYNGDLSDIDEVMREVCKNLNTVVSECKKYAVSYEITPGKSGPGAGVILLVIFMLLISATLIVLFFRRIQKRKEAQEISLEANSMVSKYMAIKDLPAATKDDEEGEAHA